MRNGTPQLSSLRRSLQMLSAVIEDGAQSNISTIARSIHMPVATAHRQVVSLIAEGYLQPIGGGRHLAGPRLASLLCRVDIKELIVCVAAPVLERLSDELSTIVQLGTFEDQMVTYRLKVGAAGPKIMTVVGRQLEAYCSGIGKVLLANLPEDQSDAYLAGGPFVPLTKNTVIDPGKLRSELEQIRANGYALDNGEVLDELYCVAVPILAPDGTAPAAISISRNGPWPCSAHGIDALPRLIDAAREIAAKAFAE